MARYKHYKNLGGPSDFIFATTTCLDHGHVFSRDEIKDKIVRITLRTHLRYGAQLHAYCLMINHLHLVSKMPEKMNSSKFMQILKDKITNTVLPLLTAEEKALMSMQVGLDRRQMFKRSFDSVVLESSRAFHQKIRYTHLNPVKASIVDTAERYRWSSAAAYEKGYWNPHDGLDLKKLLRSPS